MDRKIIELTKLTSADEDVLYSALQNSYYLNYYGYPLIKVVEDLAPLGPAREIVYGCDSECLYLRVKRLGRYECFVIWRNAVGKTRPKVIEQYRVALGLTSYALTQDVYSKEVKKPDMIDLTMMWNDGLV